MAVGTEVTMRTALADLVQSFSNVIRGKDGTRPLPGAAEPMKPAAPAGTDPRAQVNPYGQNLALRPRTGTGVQLTPFGTLRAISDFDLPRCSINDVKNQILGMRWDVRAKPEFKGQEKRLGNVIDGVRRFCDSPDPLAGVEWPEFVGAAAEELIVTDAWALLPRKNIGGELIGIERIDGATILPYVDDRGRPPLPPNPAFGQVVLGVVETEFRMGEILYLPRNRRADTPYGRSSVEAIIMTANLAVRSQLHDLGWFTDGNIPDGGFWKVPETWTPEQLEAAQKKLDEIAAGRTDVRAGYVRLMYGGDFVDTKKRTFDYEFFEWLGRVVAWGIGASSLPIAKQMNRSTGQTMESSTMESGVRPLADFIATVVNRVLRVYGGVTEVEFAWADDETEDATVVYQRQVALLGRGALTLNGVREQQGEDPYPFETPPMIDTPSGPQLLEKLIEDLKNPPEPPPELAPKPSNGTGQDAGNAPADNPPPKAAADEEPTAQEKAWAAAFTKYRAAVVVDLKKWKGVVVKRAKAGRAQKAFGSAVIPFRVRKEIGERAFSPETIQRAIDIFKGELKPTKARSKVEKAIVAIVDGWLSKLESPVIAWALQQLPVDKLAKKQDPPEDPPDFDAGHLADDLAKQLEAGGNVGVTEAAAAIGVNLDRVPEDVITYARRRAGEVVGKTYVGGVWVDSTTGSAISDKLRTLVQEAVSKSIEESWTPAELASTLKGYFEISRAQTIARTETAYAYGNGAAELYKSEGVDLLDVKDGPGCLPFGHDDNAPKPDDEKGIVQAESEAEGQIWTVGEYQGAIIGHPNCVRVATPYFAEEAAA